MSVSYEAQAVGLLTGSFSFPKALIFIKQLFLDRFVGNEIRNRTDIFCAVFWSNSDLQIFNLKCPYYAHSKVQIVFF